MHHPVSSILFSPILRHTHTDDVLLWTHSNKLKLNTYKTEVMPMGSASHLPSGDSECGNRFPFKMLAKYHRVHLNRSFSMQQHISSICHASFRDLMSRISPTIYVPKHCFETCCSNGHLEYYNSVSQVYQQTRSLGYSRCRITQCGL